MTLNLIQSTRRDQDKMATFCRRNFATHFRRRKCLYLVTCFTEICPQAKGIINNNLALAQIIAWHQTDDRSLSDRMMLLYADAYTRHSAKMG